MNREIEILQLFTFQWLILPKSAGINCLGIITDTVLQSLKEIHCSLSPCRPSLHFPGSSRKDKLISHLQSNFIWIVFLHFHLKMGTPDGWGAQIAVSQWMKPDYEDLIKANLNLHLSFIPKHLHWLWSQTAQVVILEPLSTSCVTLA